MVSVNIQESTSEDHNNRGIPAALDEGDRNGNVDMPQIEGLLPEMEDFSQVSQAEANIRQEVEEISDAFKEGAETEISLTEKVETLRASLDVITEEVQSWRGKNYYLDAIESVKSQVEEIHAEWDSLSDTFTSQRERIENLLQAFPGVIETSTLKALTMRVGHLEELVHDLVQERDTKSNSDKARKQLIVSVVALALTIVFWGAFLGIAIFG